MIEKYCNCSQNWEAGMCNHFVSGLINDEGELYSSGERYLNIFETYQYISRTKNDKVLLKFLKENYNGYYCCYKYIAILLIRQVKEYPVIQYDERIFELVMSYLYWSFGKPFDKNNILKIQVEEQFIDSIVNKGKEKNRIQKVGKKCIKATVKVRIIQSPFRKKLINKYKCCQICGLDILDLLKASHSKPFSICNYEESLDIYNGLLLCDKHDGLYDKGYITFDDDGNIIISKKLSKENIKRLDLTDDIKIELEEEHIEYIRYHRKNIFRI